MATIAPVRKHHTCSFAVSRAPDAHSDARITISTQDEDRYGDVLVPEGVDLSSYERNPVVLFGHDASALPVAKTTQIAVQPGRGIQADFKWLANDPFADRVRNAFDQGVLNGASVGFLPKKWEPHGKDGLRYLHWELLEWSIVPVPANANAVRTLKQFGLDGPVSLARASVLLDQLTTQLRNGRVLSTSNDAQLRHATDLLGGILSQPDEEPTAPIALAVDGETIVVDPQTLDAAVRQFVHDEIARAQGRIPDPPTLMQTPDAHEPVVTMSEPDLRQLLTGVLRQTVTDVINRVQGRIVE